MNNIIKEIHEFMWSDVDRLIFHSIVHEKDNVYLHGPTGTGKSSRIRYMNHVYNFHNRIKNPEWVDVPFFRVSLRDTIEDSQLFGGIVIENDTGGGAARTTHLDGFVTTSFRTGGWVLLDELDAAKPDIMFSLHPLFEDTKELLLLDNGGEIIQGHPELRFIATGNTFGRGDLSGLHPGTKNQNEALLDRFTFFNITYPDKASEINYLSRFCSRSLATHIVQLADDVRKAQEKGILNYTFSVRRTKMLAKKIDLWGLDRSLRFILFSRLDYDEKIQLSEMVKIVFGVSIDP
jgi:cobaltochelatase CobS